MLKTTPPSDVGNLRLGESPNPNASYTAPPVAAFSADDTTVYIDATVTFTDASTNTPTTWLWNFGDGNTSTTQSPTHEYEEAGTYTVVLTACNVGGCDEERKVGYITVEEAPSYVGPLDLVPGAVWMYAYSMARALGVDWLGQPLVRLRRSSDNAQMTFNADAVTGLSPDAEIIAWRDALGAATAFIVTRFDQSGNGKDATNATALEQPEWRSNQVNGHPAALCNQTSANLLTTASTLTFSGEATAISVSKFNEAGEGYICGNGEGNEWYFITNNGTAGGSGKLGALMYDGSSGYSEVYSNDNVQSTLESFFVSVIKVSSEEDGSIRLNGSTIASTSDAISPFTPFAKVLQLGDQFFGTDVEQLACDGIALNMTAAEADIIAFYDL